MFRTAALPSPWLAHCPPDATPLERLVWHLGESDGWDRRWLIDRFREFPERYCEPIAKLYEAYYRAGGRRDANLFILALAEDFREVPAPLALSDDDLIPYAKSRAAACRRIAAGMSNPAKALELLCEIARKHGVKPPVGAGSTPVARPPEPRPARAEAVRQTGPRRVLGTVAGAVNRLMDDQWWRRAIRKAQGQAIERRAIRLGLVHRHADIYASEEMVERRRQQKRRNRNTLETLIAVNELGQEYSLQELADLSVSNPRIRRAELMLRIAHFESVARSRNDVGEFYSITCPSRMHARLADSGDANPKYDGTTPSEAQKHLANLWSRARAKLARLGIQVYGFRVAEPQHDATPHWHLLLFMAARHANAVRGVLSHYALKDSPDEPGAQLHRFRAVAIDWSRGTAAGYVAKYVAKNIDGFGLDTDCYGGSAATTAQRVEAWATTWRIRQFQQIGGPPVTVWRELRKAADGAPAGVLGRAWSAADNGDWHGFVELMGGPVAKRAACPIHLARRWEDAPNRYGEPKGLQILGLEAGGVVFPTRVHQWSITRKPPQDEGNAPSLNGAGRGPVDRAPLEFCQ